MNYRRNEDKLVYPNRRLWNDVQILSEVEGSPPTPVIVTLAQFKTYAKIETTDEDTDNTDLILEARQLFEKYTGIGLVEKTITATIRNDKGDVKLPYSPVASITSIKDFEEEDVTDYEFYDDAYFRTPIGDYFKVVYVTDPTPATMAMKRAILRLAAFLWRHKGDEDVTEDVYNKKIQEVCKPFKKGSWLL